MLWAVIMAGGVGTRFWPESRKKHPKQFLRLLSSRTLIEETLLRIRPIIPPERILVVTQQDKTALVKKLTGLPASQILGEPVGRNTAPCVALAAAVIARRDPDAVLAILAADHRIEKEAAFRKSLKAASSITVRHGLPVTFGIKPSFACTGYGYLEIDKKKGRVGSSDYFLLKRFHEKPKAAKAKRFFRSKKYLWNSGMFVWKAVDMLAACKEHLPKAFDLAEKIAAGPLQKKMKKFFPAMPPISIDYGIMEKLKGGILALPADIGWDDVGGWKSLEGLLPADQNKNTTAGKTLLIDSRHNIVKSQDRLVALLGVENLVIVDTPDALLICPRDKTESIRKVVAALERKKLTEYL